MAHYITHLCLPEEALEKRAIGRVGKIQAAVAGGWAEGRVPRALKGVQGTLQHLVCILMLSSRLHTETVTKVSPSQEGLQSGQPRGKMGVDPGPDICQMSWQVRTPR